ncbi:Predicted NAD/FAD-binding protein [Ectothiorhodosinus mongolicus]|uniref:Predicted NAD/FAD-binding protein n=1 Tax=Ectothiorhodosinus mongolicus TaxID=233100 RepID=A0A1R3VQ98_9GAMM|nr:FAD-dependent oxidoreductase [Ectothiorhodosinus mongolicus]ULX56505.1 NAD/FAD-binding protein [Ectothiorhodosinus mongolicus]SIT66151.1 Predicted NAD/FAD-binding protein [Ectothiorhodosinus mongolicus]
MSSKRIAVIGGGISGLASAWLLAQKYDVTLFEKNDYIGGHTNTVEVDGDQGPIGVDTGFMVFNHRNYPNLKALFAHLGVASQPTDMSFSASINQGQLEYAGSDLNTLFGQRRNLLRPRFLRMLRDILRFNREGKRLVGLDIVPSITLGGHLLKEGYGAGFRDDYLLPMAAAIWSCPTHRMLDFPLGSFLRFFTNHGLLDLTGRPQWHTVKGGSREYVRQMLKALPERAHINSPVVQVRRENEGVVVRTESGDEAHFDQAVLGCHADQSLQMLEAPSDLERSILGAVSFQPNRAILHTDATLMPKLRRVWASWNYLASQSQESQPASAVSVTYWMNSLQSLAQSKDYFVSLNPLQDPRAETVIREISYRHPVFDQRAMDAQQKLSLIQGKNRLWFCGAWTGYGFHEDGLKSALAVARGLEVSPPWSQEASPVMAPPVELGVLKGAQAT